jgi:hypothetical protein
MRLMDDRVARENIQGLGQGAGVRQAMRHKGMRVKLRKERAWQKSPVKATRKTASGAAVSSIEVTV